MSRVAALILAAGGSTRMGRPKQLLQVGDQSLLQHAVRIASDAGAGPIRVVIGSSPELMKSELSALPVEIIENPNWSFGIGTSIRAGMNHLAPTIDAVLILLCDQPLIAADHLRALITASEQSNKPLAACSYPDGAIGTPALFSRRFFDELASLPDDAGAKKILIRHRDQLATISIPEAAIDLDTPEDYQRLNQ